MRDLTKVADSKNQWRNRLPGLDTNACLPSLPEDASVEDQIAAEAQTPTGPWRRRFNYLFNWCAVDPTPEKHKWRMASWGWKLYLLWLHPPGPTRIHVKVEDQWVKQCVCCWITRAALLGAAFGVFALSILIIILKLIYNIG